MTVHLWFFQALGAGMCWALSYVLSEKVLKGGVSPVFLATLGTVLSLPVYLLLVGSLGEAQRNLSILAGDRWLAFYALASALILVVGVLLVYGAIAGKNAALASFVEIAYPVFTVAFAWILFRDVQVTWLHVAGGLLVLAGVGLIYWKG